MGITIGQRIERSASNPAAASASNPVAASVLGEGVPQGPQLQASENIIGNHEVRLVSIPRTDKWSKLQVFIFLALVGVIVGLLNSGVIKIDQIPLIGDLEGSAAIFAQIGIYAGVVIGSLLLSRAARWIMNKIKCKPAQEKVEQKKVEEGKVGAGREVDAGVIRTEDADFTRTFGLLSKQVFNLELSKSLKEHFTSWENNLIRTLFGPRYYEGLGKIGECLHELLSAIGSDLKGGVKGPDRCSHALEAPHHIIRDGAALGIIAVLRIQIMNFLVGGIVVMFTLLKMLPRFIANLIKNPAHDEWRVGVALRGLVKDIFTILASFSHMIPFWLPILIYVILAACGVTDASAGMPETSGKLGIVFILWATYLGSRLTGVFDVVANGASLAVIKHDRNQAIKRLKELSAKKRDGLSPEDKKELDQANEIIASWNNMIDAIDPAKKGGEITIYFIHMLIEMFIIAIEFGLEAGEIDLDVGNDIGNKAVTFGLFLAPWVLSYYLMTRLRKEKKEQKDGKEIEGSWIHRKFYVETAIPAGFSHEGNPAAPNDAAESTNSDVERIDETAAAVLK